MNRIQFFYDSDLIALELKINEWLSSNKEKKIIETNLNSLGEPSARAGITESEKYIFYILYSMPEWENILLDKSAEEMLPAIEPIEKRIRNESIIDEQIIDEQN